jgi:hypothetical protein
MVGMEGSNPDCTSKHLSLKMDESDRIALLENVCRTKCVYLKPSLKNNKGLMATFEECHRAPFEALLLAMMCLHEMIFCTTWSHD